MTPPTYSTYEQIAEKEYPELINTLNIDGELISYDENEDAREAFLRGLSYRDGELAALREALEKILHGPSDRLSHSTAHKALTNFPQNDIIN